MGKQGREKKQAHLRRLSEDRTNLGESQGSLDTSSGADRTIDEVSVGSKSLSKMSLTDDGGGEDGGEDG